MRIGALNSNVLLQIKQAGLILVDITAQNPNVFYELGLTDLLGKDRFLLVQEKEKNKIPADQRGEHYYSYSLNDLPTARKRLTLEIKKWVKKYKVMNTTKYCVI